MMLCKPFLRIGILTMLCVSSSLFAVVDSNSEEALSTVTPRPAPARSVKHNPFTQPDFSKRNEQAAIEEQKAVPQALFQLRAVLYSTTAPLVNINGKILAVGEEIDGFLVQEVSEDGAVLMKNEVQIMLSMAQE